MRTVVADWVCVFGIISGSLMILYVLYCAIDNWSQNHKQHKLYTDRLRKENENLRNHIEYSYEALEERQSLIDYARSRELELTEERNRLRDRNVLMAKIITEDEVCNKKTTLWRAK